MNASDRTIDSYGRCCIEDNGCRSSRPGREYATPARTAPAQAPSLLADPTTVALLRDLYAHARHVNAEHATYSMGDGRGGAYGPKEHTWTAGELRVSYDDGELRYLSHGAPLLKVHVVSVRQAAQVLAAIGVLPQRFAVTAEQVAAMAPDTRRTATTGGAK